VGDGGEEIYRDLVARGRKDYAYNHMEGMKIMMEDTWMLKELILSIIG
jgi:hypothetical protein